MKSSLKVIVFNLEDRVSHSVEFFSNSVYPIIDSQEHTETQITRRKTVLPHEYHLKEHIASYFLCHLKRSLQYRKQVWAHLSRQSHIKSVLVHIILVPFKLYPLDYRFGSRIQLLVNETIELDHVMSCLSTLGGAFSSLGDQFLDCAKTAGKISLHQYRIAVKLGDPVTLLRCQLYFSISLIQCNRLRDARFVILLVYKTMKSKPEDLQDKRVISMCLGIWAKLKYHWHLNLTERESVHLT